MRGVPSLNAFAALPETTGVGPGRVVSVFLNNAYGWLHPSWSDTGVVICPGLEHDVSDAHRPLRLLAIDLAHSGYNVLRLNYKGTGNAPELDGEEPCGAWLGSIAAAVDRLQAIGVRRVVLCGFRLGGLLAGVAAARRSDICAVVLLDPVLQGKSYLRELEIAKSIASGDGGYPGAMLEVDGITLDSGPEAALRGLSLREQPATPAPKVLLLSSSTKPGVTKLVEHWRSRSVEVEQASFAPLSDYDNNGHLERNPGFGQIQDWLDKTLPEKSQRLQIPQLSHDTGIFTDSFNESSINFGPCNTLFGVLCSPHKEVVPGLVLLIGSIGAIPHQGSARFHVMLARRLAPAGIASFRFDFAGIGESDFNNPDAGMHVYETDRVPDFAAAIDVLQSAGYRRFAAGGLCSGAYHAWHAALGDERLEAVVMLNPTTFSWLKGQTLRAFLQDNDRSVLFYVNKTTGSLVGRMTRASGWLRLARGELNVAKLAGKAARIVGARALRGATTPFTHAAGLFGWPTRDQLPLQAMRRLSARGVHALVVMNSADSGLKMFQRCFGRNGRQLSALPNCSVQLMADVDHAFSRLAMQERVADVLLGFLRSSFPVSGKPSGAAPQSPARWAAVPGEALCRTHTSP